MIGDELFFYNALLYFPLISQIAAETNSQSANGLHPEFIEETSFRHCELKKGHCVGVKQSF